MVNDGWSADYHSISTSQQKTAFVIPKSIQHEVIATSESPEQNKLDVLHNYLKIHPVRAMVVIHRNAPISRFVHELRQRDINAVPLYESTGNYKMYCEFLQQCQSGM